MTNATAKRSGLHPVLVWWALGAHVPHHPNATLTANRDERDRAGRGAAHSAAPNATERI